MLTFFFHTPIVVPNETFQFPPKVVTFDLRMLRIDLRISAGLRGSAEIRTWRRSKVTIFSGIC